MNRTCSFKTQSGKTRFRRPVILLLWAALFLAGNACLKEDFQDLDFVIAVTEGTNPEAVDSIRLYGRIDGIDGVLLNPGLQPQEYGFLLTNVDQELTLTSANIQKIVIGRTIDANRSFNTLVGGLSVLANYYFRAYVILGERISYGDVAQFSLRENLKVAMIDSTVVTNDVATLRGRLFLNFFGDVGDYGFVYSSNNTEPQFGRDPDIRLGSPFKKDAPVQFDGRYAAQTEPLVLNTTYYVRAFARLNADVVYSEVIPFSTRDGWKKLVTPDNVFAAEEPTGLTNGASAFIGLGCDQACQVGARSNPWWEVNPGVSPAAWTEKARGDFSVRKGAVGFAIGTTIYYGLGEAEGFFLSNFAAFDPAGGGTWTPVEAFPGEARGQAVAFTLNGKGYVGTGRGSDFFDDFWVFDPGEVSGKQWNRVPNALPQRDQGQDLPLGRERAITLTIGGKVYVGGGEIFGLELTDLWEFLPATGEWSYREELPFSPALSFVINNKAHLVSDAFEVVEYTPGGAVVARTSFPQDSDYPTTLSFAFSLNGKGYIGGPNARLRTIDIWEYTPVK